ncbi:hypothetical protein BaRGS_00037131, partial [Batillaria attramentaria]
GGGALFRMRQFARPTVGSLRRQEELSGMQSADAAWGERILWDFAADGVPKTDPALICIDATVRAIREPTVPPASALLNDVHVHARTVSKGHEGRRAVTPSRLLRRAKGESHNPRANPSLEANLILENGPVGPWWLRGFYEGCWLDHFGRDLLKLLDVDLEADYLGGQCSHGVHLGLSSQAVVLEYVAVFMGMSIAVLEMVAAVSAWYIYLSGRTGRFSRQSHG